MSRLLVLLEVSFQLNLYFTVVLTTAWVRRGGNLLVIYQEVLNFPVSYVSYFKFSFAFSELL
jgi:hypothetical protein